jgi:sarcosine oxidase
MTNESRASGRSHEAGYDAIVIGVGGMGSATVFELARRGLRVLGLERYDIPHSMGSSHGINRIIRLAYSEHPAYVPLLKRSYERWRDLEARCGERLLIVTGSIDAGAADSRTFKGSKASCELHHLPHEVFEDGTALRWRFPGYRLPAGMLALYQPDGGFVLCERAIVNYVEAAHGLGAEIHAREPVISWEAGDAIVSVRTAMATYTAPRLVLTAGSWTGMMLPALAPLTRPERQVLLWAQPHEPAYFAPSVFPVFNLQAPEGHFYGFPIYGVPGFKIGRYHHRGEQVDPDNMDLECHPEDEAVIRDGLRRYFPDADGPTMAMKTCLFTNSPDEHFILDRHPVSPRVTIAAGFSGHGFKFCSVVGEIMADLSLDGETRWDLALFRLSRFSGKTDSLG